MFITVLSFGFKYGIPADADLVFDVRFLPNPYYVEELRFHTGTEQAVQDLSLIHILPEVPLNARRDISPES